MSDLQQKLEWAQTHQDEAQRIAKAGQQFIVDHLTTQHVTDYWDRLLRAYGEQQSFESELRQGMSLLYDANEAAGSHEKQEL